MAELLLWGAGTFLGFTVGAVAALEYSTRIMRRIDRDAVHVHAWIRTVREDGFVLDVRCLECDRTPAETLAGEPFRPVSLGERRLAEFEHRRTR